MDTDDRELVRRIASGDDQALRLFYRRHAGIALQLAVRVLGDRALAEDAVQDAFLAAWQNASRYDAAKASPSTWLLTFVRRRAVDIVRHRARRPAEPLEAASGERAAVEDRALARVPERAWAEHALERLTTPEREVVQLSYVLGLTHAEIARLRRVPIGTVKSRLASALARLRTSVAATG